MSSLQHRLRRLGARSVVDKLVRLRPDKPLASITFDDFPRSAWDVGGPILARHGVRGTYYASGRFEAAHEDGLDYFTADTLRAVHAAGHEIGCHTHDHRHGPEVGDAELVADVERNADWARERLGDERLSTFAYPYGDLCRRTKRLQGSRFACARGVRAGVNAGLVDLAELHGEPIEKRSWRAETIERRVAETVARRGWLVLFTHDVSDDPSPYGCTPAMLDHALTCLQTSGVEVLPVKHALARATFGG